MRDLNESPRPRVLVMLPDHLRDPVLSILGEISGTQKSIDSFEEVDPTEWDAIVMMGRAGWAFESFAGQWHPTRTVPTNLKLVALMASGAQFEDVLTDEKDRAHHALQLVWGEGKRAFFPSPLDEELEEFVKRSLLPVVREREHQFGVKVVALTDEGERMGPPFETLLAGSNGLIYAARYQRAPGSSAWVIPSDVNDLRPWLGRIFKEWHAEDPATFFGAPEWIEDERWSTADERSKLAEIQREKSDFEARRAAHERELATLSEAYETLRASSAQHERLLLNGQGIELQNEVRDVLREIGFDVEDMDPTWHEREPREDYRIRDEDEPGWMVIGDATGTTKGVKGTKLMTTQRFVTKFVSENRTAPVPNFWLIANQFAERDPSQRPALLRGDELAVVKDEGNLVLDTVALFHLITAARSNPALKEPMRTMLRKASGTLSGEDALNWITANTTA
ncbi:hypothetical protein MHY30_07440 [Microbacterium sp. ACRRU]|uniref:hypothetical protein n=1 Tax=Microbacterium sp. ACRRU TaxID=2918204 RepID=UPI001EF62C5E|nr:hypothetical protein [Microbacterium sp. ACRRU]MCG7417332.1 hypothetical protein [Microbacterium sp. ACRRU]